MDANCNAIPIPVGGRPEMIDFYYFPVFMSSTSPHIINRNVGPIWGQFPATITANQWYHFAGVRSNGVARAFINGSSGTPTNNSQSVDAQSSGVNIGWSTFTANRRAYNGYIDELRITRGVARYTANFYIPRAAFPDA